MVIWQYIPPAGNADDEYSYVSANWHRIYIIDVLTKKIKTKSLK